MIVFFAAQIIGFLIVDFIALAIMTCCVSMCCNKSKKFLTYMMWESLVIYEDYKYVVQFTHTKLA